MFLIFRVLWRQLQRQKLKQDASQEPLSVELERTPAFRRSLSTDIKGAPHYLKNSSNSISIEAHCLSTLEIIVPCSAEESDPNTSVHDVEDGTSNVDSRATLSENRVTTNREDKTSDVDSRSTLSENQMTHKREFLTGTLGQLFFSTLVRPEKDKFTLVVSIIKCSNLPAKGLLGLLNLSANHYVKLRLLLPDKQYKVKTRVMRTRNPIYEEDFSFYGIKASQLQSIELDFEVLTFDRHSRDEIVGEVSFSLDSLEENTKFTFQRDIERRILEMPRPSFVKCQGRGLVLISLSWKSLKNRLSVIVDEAVLPGDVIGSAESYVQIYLTYKNQRIAKKKTRGKKRHFYPRFSQTFDFEIPDGDDGLRHIGLEVLLMGWNRATRNKVIGRVEFRAKGDVESAEQHWLEICKLHGGPIALWYQLYK